MGGAHRSSKPVLKKWEGSGDSIPPPKRKVMLNFVKDNVLGYMYAYAPEHPYANRAGKVYEHIYVMSEHIGRKLNPDECVHHIDRNRENNRIENLQLLTLSEHAKLHAREDKGIEFIKTNCLTCGKVLEISINSSQIYCSHECFHKQRLKFEISKEDLEVLVWSFPTTQIAKILGVSDVTVSNRCGKLGVRKPPRGFWAKVEAGLIIANGLPQ